MDGIEASSEGRVRADQGKRIRRHWATEINRRIVREAEKPGAVKQQVAERHGVHVSALNRWRTEFASESSGARKAARRARLVPVRVSKAHTSRAPIRPLPATMAMTGTDIMEVAFPAGQRVAIPRCRQRRCVAHGAAGALAVLMGLPSGSRIWLAAGVTDLRKGMDGLSALVQTALQESAYSGHIFVLRGRRGDKVKVLWYSGDGVCLFCKRLSDGRFVWPQTQSGAVSMSGTAVDVARRD